MLTRNRKFAIILFYFGLACIAVATFINFTYIRPTDFKAQFRQHQLADCIAKGTPRTTCQEHFGSKR